MVIFNIETNLSPCVIDIGQRDRVSDLKSIILAEYFLKRLQNAISDKCVCKTLSRCSSQKVKVS